MALARAILSNTHNKTVGLCIFEGEMRNRIPNAIKIWNFYVIGQYSHASYYIVLIQDAVFMLPSIYLYVAR
jgi:hypothetical protein